MSLQRMVLKTSSLANIRSTTWPFLVLFGVARRDVHALCVGHAPIAPTCDPRKVLQPLIGRDQSLYSSRPLTADSQLAHPAAPFQLW